MAAALGLRSGRAVAAVACVSLVTNPLLTFGGLLLAQAFDWSSTPAGALAVIVPAEIAVVLAEWRKAPPARRKSVGELAKARRGAARSRR